MIKIDNTIRLEYTLPQNILPVNQVLLYSRRRFNIEDRISDVLVSERYILNLEKSSTVNVDCVLAINPGGMLSFGIYSHTFIVKDIHGKYYSGDFSKRLISVQIEELLKHGYLINLNALPVSHEE